ncbi:MAG TPA: carboxypeptidase-like regulatory domain-containing protein [Turneriella sp.]|nr:carboxypeptidase-like regulatory domain-containing protein [Turneriella sp.]
MVKVVPGLFPAFFLFTLPLFAQALTISGRTFNESTGEPLEFGTVIVPEAKFKSRINPDGTYAAAVPGPGEYTIQLSAPGLKTLTEKVRIDANLKRALMERA